MPEIDPTNPVNKKAAVVVSKVPGVAAARVGDKIFSMAPLPMRQFPGPPSRDLTGQKSGRYTVIGCALWMPRNWRTSSNSVRWVVRCVCGRYAMLTTKAVKKNHPDNMCLECKKTMSARWRAQQ